jgi:hypothetical protein
MCVTVCFFTFPDIGYQQKYEAVSASHISLLCFLNNIHVKLAIHFSLEDMIVKKYLYLLVAQTVSSKSSKHFSTTLGISESKFYLGTKRPVLYFTRPVDFFKEGPPNKIMQ